MHSSCNRIAVSPCSAQVKMNTHTHTQKRREREKIRAKEARHLFCAADAVAAVASDRVHAHSPIVHAIRPIREMKQSSNNTIMHTEQ